MLCKKTVASAIFAGAVFVFCANVRAQDGEPYEACGMLRDGVEAGCFLFFPADATYSGGLLVENAGTFQDGDGVRIAGVLVLGCQSGCQQGEGCVFDNTISGCALVPAVSATAILVMGACVVLAGILMLRRHRIGG